MFCVFFFNDTATTEIYTLSLHDALPISECYGDHLSESLIGQAIAGRRDQWVIATKFGHKFHGYMRRSEPRTPRSEEHTSELQSRQYLVCRLLLEKKKITRHGINTLTDLH